MANENFKPMETPHKITIDKWKISKEHYEKLKCNEYQRVQGNRNEMYFEANWLYIKYAYEDNCLYKVEIKQKNGEYFIDEFFVEGNTSKIDEKLLGSMIFETDKGNINQLKYLLFVNSFKYFTVK